jgi:prevent-host-death family protein
MQLNIHEAKTQLSKLTERVLKGERVVIARAGKPCVDLVPHHRQDGPRQPGRYRDQIVIHDDFDASDAEIQALFEGDS